jgi:rod shape-determining protein mreC
MSESLSFTQRGIRPVNKLICLSLASIALLTLDNHFSAVKTAKQYVATSLYPLQWLANKPVEWYEYSNALLQSQTYLLSENQRLTQENAKLRLHASQVDMQTKRLEELQSLLALKNHGLTITTAAEIISNGKEPIGSKVIINKGTNDHIRAGDAVVDENGLVGQVSQSYPFSAEVHLLTDAKAVIPVMVARTGVRTLVYGGSDQLSLRYFPSDADLQPEDMLVTSGLDSVYPAGIPVAKVVQTGRNTGMPYYSAQLKPVAALRSSKYVLVLPQQPLPQTGETTSDAAAASVPSAKP